MLKRPAIAIVLLLGAFTLGAEEVLYQIDLIPSGKAISKDLPTLKGGSYLYHQFPAGTLISVKKSTVKKISKMTPEAIAQVDPKQKLTSIRDLPMQGPKQSLGGRPSNMGRARDAVSAANAGTAGRTASPD
jgi:hypothetical protein